MCTVHFWTDNTYLQQFLLLALQKDTGVSALLMDYCSDIGVPRSYGDPITGRIHCDLVHDGHPGGCEGNAARRFSRGFAQAFLVRIVGICWKY
jgi:hypothetical protein